MENKDRFKYMNEYNFLTKELNHSYVYFYKIFNKYDRKYTVFIEKNFEGYYVISVVSTYKQIIRNEEKKLYEISEDYAHMQTGFDNNDTDIEKHAHELIDLLYNVYQKEEHIVRCKSDII